MQKTQSLSGPDSMPHQTIRRNSWNRGFIGLQKNQKLAKAFWPTLDKRIAELQVAREKVVAMST